MKIEYLGLGILGSIAVHAVVLGLFCLTNESPKGKPPVPTNELAAEASAAETNAVSEVAPSPESRPILPVPEAAAAAKSTPEPKALEAKPSEVKPMETAAPAAPAAQPKIDLPRSWKMYVVKRGDTLTALADEAGCSIAEIARLNKKSVAQISQLKIGQRIKLPQKRQ